MLTHLDMRYVLVVRDTVLQCRDKLLTHGGRRVFVNALKSYGRTCRRAETRADRSQRESEGVGEGIGVVECVWKLHKTCDAGGANACPLVCLWKRD